MKKKFIFFRHDRLGDFLIVTSLIKSLKKKFPNSKIIVFCSPLNFKFIKSYKLIDKVILYDKKFSLKKKYNIFNKIIKDEYYASFSIDGKSISNLFNFFLKSKYKLGIVYRYIFLGLWLTKPNFFYTKLIFNKYETFTSKKYLNKIEHLPSKIISLGNFFKLNLKPSNKYFFLYNKKFDTQFHIIKKKIKGKYILIHLDEKWQDIKNINNDLYNFVSNMQIETGQNIIITSYKNKFDYYKILKTRLNKKINKKIHLFDNFNLELMERFINYSSYSISCHSGFLVQVAGANTSKIIDIINNNDYKWYSCWKPKNTVHKFVFKSIVNKISLTIILKSILSIINKGD